MAAGRQGEAVTDIQPLLAAIGFVCLFSLIFIFSVSRPSIARRKTIAKPGFFETRLYKNLGGYVVCPHCGSSIPNESHVVLYPLRLFLHVSEFLYPGEGWFRVRDPENRELFLIGCISNACLPWQDYAFGNWTAKDGFIPVADFCFETARIFGKVAAVEWRRQVQVRMKRPQPREQEDDPADREVRTERSVIRS